MSSQDAGMEQALRDSELRYRRLFEAAKDGILILEASTGRITDVNPFLAQLLGFSRDEMVGRTVGELSPFQDVVSNADMLSRLQADGYVRYEHLPLKTKDGREISVEFVSNVYRAGDKHVIQCNIRDITERRAAEVRIQQLHRQLEQLNQELETRVVARTAQLRAANAELEAFSHSVSHDLRAPLRHIGGFVELLRQDVGAGLSARGLRHMDIISASVQRMGSLIDDLLAFSRVGRAVPQLEPIDLGRLMAEVVREQQADSNGRDIDWQIHPLPEVRADRALLRLVLINLVSNAVKFTQGRAQARIEIGHAPDDGTRTAIFIRDNGAGFDPQYVHKLFGVFQRLHSQHEFAGTGIGLANVQRIVQRHGGRVWAVGVPDQGATFTFSLPRADAGTDVG